MDKLNQCFFWTAWAAVTHRPGPKITYTNNWPPDALVGNRPAGALLLWTGVIVRSAANIEAGARGRWSTILHGTWIALFVLALPSVLNTIPLTVLATVLILTGWKLINLAKVFSEAKTRPVDTALWMITVLAILTTDLLKGLIIALVSYAAYRFYSKRAEKDSIQIAA